MDKMRIHEMLEKMTEWALSEMQAKGKEGVDTKEMGEVIDMVKDLADAEKSVWEKCYYESIVKAMEDYGEEEGRSGYDRWRYSSGRFAPKGRGHETSMAVATGRAGFAPDPRIYYDDPRMWDKPWLGGVAGYDEPNRNSNGSGSNWSNGGSDQSSTTAGRMGYTPVHDGRMANNTGKGTHYDMYDSARRHFHETGDQHSKQEMSDKAKDYLEETVATMRDIFAEADPDMQNKMRSDLSRLYREFGGK